MTLQSELPSLELYTWGSSGTEYPSFDPFCLSVMAYLQMNSAPWSIHVSRNPKVSPNGEFPVLKVGVEPVVGVANILSTLKTKGISLDENLSVHDRIHMNAYISLIQDTLFEGLLYNWWLEHENRARSTGKRYHQATTFLSRYSVMSDLHSRASKRLQKYGKIEDGDQYVSELYARSREAYRALAIKLGDKTYFFGEHPTTLDAIAFGHLAIDMIPSLVLPKLFSMLTFEFPTLIAFVHRTNATFFKDPIPVSPTARLPFRVHFANFIDDPHPYVSWIMNGFQKKLISSAKQSKESDKDREERVERFWKGFSVFSAVVCFVAFVSSHGLVKVSFEGSDEGKYDHVD